MAASFETGPLYLSAGYFTSEREWTGDNFWFSEPSTFENIALTADYTMAPGLGVYAEIDMISDELLDGVAPELTNDTTLFIAGMNVSF